MIGSGFFRSLINNISGLETKIDQSISDISGLDTKIDLLTEEREHLEHHFHNTAIWFGAGGTEGSLTGYVLTSGNNIYGASVDVLTNVQTPFRVGKLFFDFHKVAPIAVSSATAYYIKIIFGTGTIEDAEAANQFSVFPIISSGVGANVRGSAIEIYMPKTPVGTKIWAKCKNATNNATITFLFGLHEYDF